MTARAIDTNVLARFLLQDHDHQSPAAGQIVARGAIVQPSVLLETAWLLRSRYAAPRHAIADLLESLFQIETITIIDAAAMHWVIERYRNGADFADMIHLASARGADVFATFDKAMAKRAGTQSPVFVETVT